jgi:hypothetical protein
MKFAQHFFLRTRGLQPRRPPLEEIKVFSQLGTSCTSRKTYARDVKLVKIE